MMMMMMMMITNAVDQSPIGASSDLTPAVPVKTVLRIIGVIGWMGVMHCAWWCWLQLAVARYLPLIFGG